MMLGTFVDFMISSLLLAAIMTYYGVATSTNILFLPLFVIMLVCAAIGSGLWVAALNVKYRDFGYIVPFVIQFGLYISPVAFTASLVPEKWKFLYALNPMVGVINGFRWSLVSTSASLDAVSVSISMVVIMICLYMILEVYIADLRII